METLMTDQTVSMSEFKRNPAAVLKSANNRPVAVLNHNRPEAYLLPAEHYEQLMAHLEDLEDAKLAHERALGPFVDVVLDDL